MTVSIDPEYQTYEQVAANIRSALGTGVKVFESVPFLPSAEEFDKLVLATFESANPINSRRCTSASAFRHPSMDT